MKRLLRFGATVVAVILGFCGIALLLYAWDLPPFADAVEETNNAYVRGKVTIVAPQLSGHVDEVAVQDFQSVEAGQLLVRLDDRIYRQKLTQAEAALAEAEAALAGYKQDRLSAEATVRSREAGASAAEAAVTIAEANWKRMEALLERGVVTASEGEQSRADLARARAGLNEAKAALEVARQQLQTAIMSRATLEASVRSAQAAVALAEIDLDNTRITAPQDGRLGEVGARVGQYVTPGTQLVAVVPDRKWVVANYKETQLAGMKVGQPVALEIDAFGGAVLAGHIERFSPATGSEFSVLRPENATGNFTKVIQRLPVRISIDPGQPRAADLAPGMSVIARVDTAAPAEDTVAEVDRSAGSDAP